MVALTFVEEKLGFDEADVDRFGLGSPHPLSHKSATNMESGSHGVVLDRFDFARMVPVNLRSLLISIGSKVIEGFIEQVSHVFCGHFNLLPVMGAFFLAAGIIFTL